MKYIKTNEYYCGFSEILKISDVYNLYPDFFKGVSVLITSLDSNREPGKTSFLISYFEKKGWKFRVLNNSILVHETNVAELLKEPRLFIHFDEVYLLEDYSLEDFNFNKFFTPILDSDFFNEEVSEDFLKICRKIKAKRFLSDGCGLNFACESLEIVKGLEEAEKTRT